MPRARGLLPRAIELLRQRARRNATIRSFPIPPLASNSRASASAPRRSGIASKTNARASRPVTPPRLVRSAQCVATVAVLSARPTTTARRVRLARATNASRVARSTRSAPSSIDVKTAAASTVAVRRTVSALLGCAALEPSAKSANAARRARPISNATRARSSFVVALADSARTWVAKAMKSAGSV